MQEVILATITEYLARFRGEQYRLRHLTRQLAEEPDRVFARDNMVGHITSSVLVLNEHRTQVLLIFHRALQAWLPPGGHYEGPGGLVESAARELAQETGLKGAVMGRLLDIDTHEIPARPARGEGTHFHHDFLFLARLPAGAADPLVLELEEVSAAQWFPTGKLVGLGDRRLARVGAKLQAILSEPA